MMSLEFPLFIEFDVDGNNTGLLLFSSNDDGVFIDSGNPIRVGIKTTNTAEEWLDNDYAHLVGKKHVFKHPKFEEFPVCPMCNNSLNKDD